MHNRRPFWIQSNETSAFRILLVLPSDIIQEGRQIASERVIPYIDQRQLVLSSFHSEINEMAIIG